MNNATEFGNRSIRLLGSILIAVAILLSTHLGEFWPFSIYPMFSQAGKEWERSLVRDVSDTPEQQIWKTVHSAGNLQGTAFAVNEVNINQNDVANYSQKASSWDDRKIRGMRHLFRSELNQRDLLLMKVTGSLKADKDSVILNYTPFMLMRSDTTIFNAEMEISR
jgi:hypothetical protein